MHRRKPGFGRGFPDHLITVVDVDDVSSTTHMVDEEPVGAMGTEGSCDPTCRLFLQETPWRPPRQICRMVNFPAGGFRNYLHRGAD